MTFFCKGGNFFSTFDSTETIEITGDSIKCGTDMAPFKSLKIIVDDPEQLKEITLIGNCENVMTTNGNIMVAGDAGTISTTNGSVTVSGSVKGNVRCVNGTITGKKKV